MFDALTFKRIYHLPRPIPEAIVMMSELRATQFEPRLLDAFFASIDEISDIRAGYPDLGDENERIRAWSSTTTRSSPTVWSDSSTLGPTKVAGTAGSVAEAVAAALAYEPDVILMDFALPDGDGVEATERIKVLMPNTKVIMLTARTDDAALVRAIGAGCSGFVRKEDTVETLLDRDRSDV